MFYPTRKRWGLLLLLLFIPILTVTISAAEITVDPETQFCFSGDDFAAGTSDGIFLTSVPSGSVAELYCGSRLLHAGDAISHEAMDNLTLVSQCITGQTATIGYYGSSENGAYEQHEMVISILPKKNEPPEARNGSLETYRNIANTGKLDASDPENAPLTYQIVMKPKRGTVTINDDGSFTYTPDENKVGKDSFTYTATDDAGQTSEPAKISIEIKKPSDKEVYADLSADSDLFTAMWMKEEGLYCGSMVGDHLCFGPDQPVTRGDFLVMVMKLVEADTELTDLQSGFSDELSTPRWLQPYIVTALRNGMISGSQYESGMEFRPMDALTHAEAAVMVQNILQLPESSAQMVSIMDSNSLPAWAERSAATLSAVGMEFDTVNKDAVITRRDAGQILYQTNLLLEKGIIPTFYWAQ